MSKTDAAESIAIAAAIIVVALAFFGIIYFLFVYNNSQNIKRDEFYASHCKTVTAAANVNGTTAYSCGSQK